MKTANIKQSGGGELKGDGLFEEIISLENLFVSWKEFKKGKTKKKDVQKFQENSESNILKLREDLKSKIYQHSEYFSFYVKDPKLRHIHKASVKDRVLHHAVFRILYPIFDKTFIFDSYSCRIGKGTHRAVNRLNDFARKVGKNNTKICYICYILKCDIRKFFDSINQDVLADLITRRIKDEDAIWLINKIIKSFPKGLPLGNITSQLFANVYLNELDKFVKHCLKEKHYIRYCDDFLILSPNKFHLESLAKKINNFVQNNLNLSLHPDKIIIRKYSQGVDFLGYVSFSHHKILRVKTKKRIFRNLNYKQQLLKEGILTKESFNQTLQSYLGVLQHCNSHKVRRIILFQPH